MINVKIKYEYVEWNQIFFEYIEQFKSYCDRNTDNTEIKHLINKNSFESLMNYFLNNPNTLEWLKNIGCINEESKKIV